VIGGGDVHARLTQVTKKSTERPAIRKEQREMV
jgi:hypothetical protein